MFFKGETEQEFQQWKNSMSIEIRRPGGLSIEQRQNVWISLAQKYIHDIHLDWDKTQRFAFNTETYPEDEQLNNQIIKVILFTKKNRKMNFFISPFI